MNTNPRNNPISQEFALMKSLFISLAGKDTEGGYNPAFVRRILTQANKKATHQFKNSRDFLASIS